MLVYKDSITVKNSLSQLDCDHINFFEKDDTQAVGFAFENYAVIVFRGTQEPEDIKVDACFRKEHRPARHRGFHQAWRAIESDVLKWIYKLPKEARRLIISGHSLGGALAILSGFEMSKEDIQIHSIITFGAPRVGGRDFRDGYKHLDEITWRVEFGTDLVTRIPPWWLGYCHVGQGISLTVTGEIIQRKILKIETRIQEIIPSSTIFSISEFLRTYQSQLLTYNKWTNVALIIKSILKSTYLFVMRVWSDAEQHSSERMYARAFWQNTYSEFRQRWPDDAKCFFHQHLDKLGEKEWHNKFESPYLTNLNSSYKWKL